MTIRVMVVDDSVVIRRLVTKVLEEDPDITVVGTAVNGRVALDKLDALAPDLVTLDIEMPELDGLATLKLLRRSHPRLPVVMFSTLTERAAKATLEALALGANDYVAKPANVGSVAKGMESVREQLVPKIKALCASRSMTAGRTPAGAAARPVPGAATATARPAAARPPVPAASTAASVPLSTAPVKVLAVGCSTGGPEALSAVLRALPASLPVPVVVVQHMPPVFTAMFAQRLDSQCALRVKEAEDGDLLEPGRVLLAPGDFHMTVVRSGARQAVRLDQTPPQNWCRPAVDPLFRSVANVFGGGVLAVVLTGMGQDGLRGADDLRRGGAPVVVQDEATSVVWGMPGAVANAGLATKVLPLSAIAAEVQRVVSGVRAAEPELARR